MSRASSKSSLAAAVIFILLAAAAALAGRFGADDWRGREKELLETRQTMLAGARFHQPLPQPAYPESSSFCSECHSLPPHPGDGVAEIFLNHHASSFECLVCHWPSSGGPQPGLVWSRPRPGAAEEEGPAGRLLLRMAEPPGGGQRDLAAMRERAVPGRICFDRGPACGKCHRKGGMSRFARSGTPPQTAAALENLPNFLTLSRGARWYFPQRR